MNNTKTKINTLNEEILVERLRGLDYATLTALESEYQEKFKWANEELDKVHVKEPSFYGDLGLNAKDIQSIADKYFQIYSACTQVKDEFKDRLFGRDPLNDLARKRMKQKFKVVKTREDVF